MHFECVIGRLYDIFQNIIPKEIKISSKIIKLNNLISRS